MNTNPSRDRAFGKYYARNGLRVSRSELEPLPEQRMSSWAAKYFRLPADKRNPPSRIKLPESKMETVTSIFSRMTAKPDYEKIAVEDVRNALVNMPEHRIVIAQSRALRSLDRGIPLGTAISRAVAWARCAVEPSEPNPPQAA